MRGVYVETRNLKGWCERCGKNITCIVQVFFSTFVSYIFLHFSSSFSFPQPLLILFSSMYFLLISNKKRYKSEIFKGAKRRSPNGTWQTLSKSIVSLRKQNSQKTLKHIHVNRIIDLVNAVAKDSWCLYKHDRPIFSCNKLIRNKRNMWSSYRHHIKYVERMNWGLLSYWEHNLNVSANLKTI